MKKIIILLISFILVFSCTALADEEQAPTVKIGLFFGSTAKESVTFTSEEGFVLGFGESLYYEESFTMAETQITVSKSDDGNFTVNGSLFDCGGEMSIKPIGTKIAVDGAWYRGFISLKRLSGSDMTVINVVDMEEYLYSVIGREMSPSWNIEALKAQAVCARTYAVENLNTYKDYGFDLCTTQRTQVYPGMESETESTIQAVEETRGKTVLYDGKPAEVFYYSCSGGQTASSKDVWMADLPYLKSKEDPYENENEATYANWSVTLTTKEIKQKVRNSGAEIGEILSIEITGEGDGGIVTELTITGTEGEKVLKKEATRTFLGLRSQDFDIEGAAAVLYDIDGNRVDKSRTVLTADGEEEIDIDNICFLTADGSISYPKKNEGGETYTFNGHGWGHKVGMSQWGAKAMADQGFSYIDILQFYFTGVDIQ